VKNKSARLLLIPALCAAPVASYADYIYTFSLDQAVSNQAGTSTVYDAASFSFEAPTLPVLGATFSVTPAANVDGAVVTSVSVDGVGGNSWNFSTQPTALTNPIGAVDYLAFTIDLSDPPSPGVYTTIFAGRCLQNSSNGCGVLDADGSLTITPVPLPASAWLMLNALCGLGVMGRKRRYRFASA
jgi:hypothetical protein